RLAKLRCHQILQLKLLFDAERQKLVRSLADLQAAGRALTGRGELIEDSGILLDILRDLRLDSHRLAVGSGRGIELGAGLEHALIAGERLAERPGEELLDLLIQPGNLELDPFS